MPAYLCLVMMTLTFGVGDDNFIHSLWFPFSFCLMVSPVIDDHCLDPLFP
jgi:hypothetical protein